MLSRFMWATVALAASGPVIAAAAVADAGADVVAVDGGRIQGRTSEGVQVFKGIAYARAPVGELRWRAPQPVVPWTGVRPARAYGPDCMQRPFPRDDAPLTTEPAEDCLYANVWRPAQAQGRLPVLVWIHGGGFVNGGASPPSYAGAALARQGVLVFSFNYRLGRFGTFAHPRLGAADADGAALANYGYMDQIAALRWVQRNIAAFGGDPGNVTVMGESAGGMSVHALLTSPQAQGLFHRAVILSGGAPGSRGTLAYAQQAGLRFARGQGIEAQDPQAVAKLRALPAEAVVGDLNLETLDRDTGPAGTYSFPVADGVVAVDSAAAYAAGRFNHVPLMVGATADDIGGPDGFMIAGARASAEVFARAGLPTWYYRFGYVAEATRAVHPKGAAHASDIPYFMDTVGVRYGGDTRPADVAMARTASAYLVNFVRSGDPNGGPASNVADDAVGDARAGEEHAGHAGQSRLPAWPRYSTAGRAMLTLGKDGEVAAAPEPTR